MILGIDEVGRGPWAGPLVVGAVVLGDTVIDGLNDSKKLTKKRREVLDAQIREQAAGFGLGWVEAAELDEVGLSEALRLATRRAVEQVKASYHEIIIDGTINFLKDTTKGRYVTTLAKADALVPAVSAASIIAKVARDRFMVEQEAAYPGYGFSAHVGYGTAQHRQAIETLGVTPLHRLSFSPLKQYRVTTRAIGDAGETAAANELARRGHTIIVRNWKTKTCEIDIISQKGKTLYFTEVKHRKNDLSGDGLAAITSKKVAQMQYAAALYAHTYNKNGVPLQLLAVATTGEPPRVVSIVEVD